MREDMAKLIVERPRRKPRNIQRKGRHVAFEDMPCHEGMQRSHQLHGECKEFSENLNPLRRYLEKQVGRPWDRVYAEISRHLRTDHTLQQHVRDHIADFVAVRPDPSRPSPWPDGHSWSQRLYVHPVTGLLCRTDRLPAAKARRRALRQRRESAPERIRLSDAAELRLLGGLWYHVTLAPMPEASYVIGSEKHYRYRRKTKTRIVLDVPVRRIVTPEVWDVVEKKHIPVGPTIDNEASWRQYRWAYPLRSYAVCKRKLSGRELKRHGLHDRAG